MPKTKLTKREVEVMCSVISQHIELGLQRKMGELKIQETNLRKQASSIYTELATIQELSKAYLDAQRFVRCAKLALAYVERIKNASLLLEDSVKARNPSLVRPIQPYFEGLLYCIPKLNIQEVKRFAKFFEKHFGSRALKTALNFNQVLEELSSIYPAVEPTLQELDEFIEPFLTALNSPVPFKPLYVPPPPPPQPTPLEILGSQVIAGSLAGKGGVKLDSSFEVLLPALAEEEVEDCPPDEDDQE